jgi:hypothetical protein
MSKVDDLRSKYKSVSNSSFSKFEEADFTPTKKYLDFMLKTWEDRKIETFYRTTGTIIKTVNQFHELLPYIDNKDIYSKEYYGNFGKLIDTVENAKQVKDEKSFVKEEHINILLETDEFLLLHPKTHKGSIKYGANTKWCTTSKNNESVFKNYTRDGLLGYLIDKTETKTGEYNKIALYLEYNCGGINDNVKLYDVKDKYATEDDLIQSGWNIEKIFEIFTTFRYYFIKVKDNKRSRDFVNTFVNTLNKLDFNKFETHMNKLDADCDLSYIKNTQSKVELFIESLNKSKYGVRKAEN